MTRNQPHSFFCITTHAEGQVETVKRACANAWTRDRPKSKNVAAAKEVCAMRVSVSRINAPSRRKRTERMNESNERFAGNTDRRGLPWRARSEIPSRACILDER